MDRKTLLTTLLIGGGTDAGTAIAQLQHAVSVLDETKADKTGTVALANNLTPYSADSGATQTIPFINQGTGCGNGESIVDTGSYSQVKKKLGNTACVNQLVEHGNFDSIDGWNFYNAQNQAVAGNVLTFEASSEAVISVFRTKRVPAGRKVLLSVEVKCTAAVGFRARYPFISATTELTANTWTRFNLIGTADSGDDGGKIGIQMWAASGATYSVRNFNLIDLSLWYGSTSNIPANLLSHPEDFGRYYSGSLAYNPGQLVNADGSVLTSIGRQMWDETWEVGQYKVTTGEKQNANDRIRSKGTIPCSPNTPIFYYIPAIKGNLTVLFYDAQGNYIDYYDFNPVHNFTTPANCYFMTFFSGGSYGTTYANDITFSRYYPGESGYDQYYPYTVLAQIDTGSEVLRSSFGVADEKEPSGLITRKIDYYTILGTDVWRYYGTPETGFWYLDAKFPNSAPSTQVMNGKGIHLVTANATGQIRCYPQYNTGVITNETDMSTIFPIGSVFHCARTTPTTEQGTAFSGASADNFAIDDFGSMYWTQTNGVPQGVEIFYPYDYKAAVDTLLNMVEGDVEKLVTETKLGAVADRIPEAPAEDGTYTLKATVADGVKTYAWVADA